MMRIFAISPLDERYSLPLERAIDDLTKPKGALGKLEVLARQIGMIQSSLTPKLKCPRCIIFCADHGIVEEGISQSPKEVTWQVVHNIASGGAGVCYLCAQHGIELRLVDVGVDRDLSDVPGVVARKIARGTRSYLYGYAMSEEEMERAIDIGVDEVDEAHRSGSNVVIFGEMGVTNTSTSAVWMSLLTGISLSECVGRGSGLNDEGLQHKYDVLSRAISKFEEEQEVTPINVIRYFGGFEMVAAMGGMLRAAELGMTIIIDGFIMTACLLAAQSLYPEVCQYVVYGHKSDEAGHELLLRYLGAMPLLQLDMRLGEGSGAACAYPIVQSAVGMLSSMARFSGGGVTKYFD